MSLEQCEQFYIIYVLEPIRPIPGSVPVSIPLLVQCEQAISHKKLEKKTSRKQDYSKQMSVILCHVTIYGPSLFVYPAEAPATIDRNS